MKLQPFSSVVTKDRPIVDDLNRYDVGRVLYDGTYTYAEMPLVNSVPDRDGDVYHTVESGQEGKLDWISYIYYGTPYLWWLIARANKILNPLRIEAGRRLRIPAFPVLDMEELKK